MSLKQNSTGSVIGTKQVSKDSISLRKIQSVSKLASFSLMNNSSKVNLKSKLALNPSVEALHKRAVSDYQGTSLFRSSQTTESMHKSLLTILNHVHNPEEKISILLEFIDNVLKVTPSAYSEILGTISETIKEYQKYAKNIDSTRVDHDEPKVIEKLVVKNNKSSGSGENKRKLNASHVLQKSKFKKNRISIKEGLTDKESSSQESVNELQILKIPTKTKHRSMKTCVSIPGLDIPSIEPRGYHQEFLEKYDEFSESWREEIRKLNKF